MLLCMLLHDCLLLQVIGDRGGWCVFTICFNDTFVAHVWEEAALSWLLAWQGEGTMTLCGSEG